MELSGRHGLKRPASNYYLGTNIGEWFEKHRVHIRVWFYLASQGLSGLRSADFAAVPCDNAVQGHVLRLEGGNFQSPALQDSTQACRHQAFAGIRTGTLYHDGVFQHILRDSFTLALKISTVSYSSLLVLPALFLDEMLGEPQVMHPLSLFGGYAGQIEELFHPGQGVRRRIPANLLGGLALVLAVVPPVVALSLLRRQLFGRPLALAVLDSVVLYFCIAPGSLVSHAMQVYDALAADDLNLARQMVGRIVSRDTANLNEEQVATAAIESVLENGNDAVFAALFWFLLGGSGGSLFYRLANTLDAMWGYRNERFLDFGCPAARLDDVLNYVPARLSSMSYALAGDTSTALACWSSQAGLWYSPNAGPVMAAGAAP